VKRAKKKEKRNKKVVKEQRKRRRIERNIRFQPFEPRDVKKTTVLLGGGTVRYLPSPSQNDIVSIYHLLHVPLTHNPFRSFTSLNSNLLFSSSSLLFKFIILIYVKTLNFISDFDFNFSVSV
jgi:hypothetical protein